eukprot:SAG22_NODE_21037_length_260_cov_0.962733_1_plen_49_part_10
MVEFVRSSLRALQGFGLLDMNTSDGRFLFLLPWQGFIIVGSTDRKGTPN